ncbi:uncharacterized protein LOC142339194 isoform X2 [Convolutriloba macropyga]|uniref:uncharacterized protein LOC142339194 isoform X2 n=1 Tax=Convolutriloba macropyga TaxID=536237 RepID=UPI003F51F2B8
MAGNEKQLQRSHTSKDVGLKEETSYSDKSTTKTVNIGANCSQSNQQEDSDAEVALLSREKDVLSQLIAEREMYEYLVSDLRKLRRLHQYMGKSTAGKNARTEQLKAEVHKLHTIYKKMDSDANSQIASMRYELTNLSTEVEALQREVETSRVHILKEELKTLDSQMAKLQQTVMQDKIKYAQSQQRLAQKHMRRMEELKQSGIKLSPRDENEMIVWKPRNEQQREMEKLQRQKYEDDLQRVRSKRSAFYGSKHSSHELASEPRLLSRRAKTFDQSDPFFNSRNLDDDDQRHTFIPRAVANPIPEVTKSSEKSLDVRNSEDASRLKVEKNDQNVSRTVEISEPSEGSKQGTNKDFTTEVPKVYVCQEYQRDDRCKFKDDHFALKGKEKHVIMRHICARCYRNLGAMNRHPMESKLCGARVHGYESSGSPAAKLSMALASEESIQHSLTNTE